MGQFAGVAISCMYLILASLFLEMISVAELQLLTMGLSNMFFVFSLGSTRVVFWYCVVISKIVLFLVFVFCFFVFVFFNIIYIITVINTRVCAHIYTVQVTIYTTKYNASYNIHH